MKITLVPGRDRLLAVTVKGRTKTMEIAPPSPVRISAEPLGELPVFDNTRPPWLKGVRLPSLVTCECSLAGALDPASLRLTVAGSNRKLLPEKDYQLDPVWATVGKAEGSSLAPGEQVVASYSYRPRRLDSIVQTPDGDLLWRKGRRATACPHLPKLRPGEKRLANLYFSEHYTALAEEMIYPVLTNAIAPRPKEKGAATLPVALTAKLKAGAPVHILAWGDSVTEATYLADKRSRWQEQFLVRLRKRFPKAKITLETVAWGGKNTNTFFETHPGYEELVLAAKPDLVISEFVNDAGLSSENFRSNYQRIRDDFRGSGIDWIVLVPHYIRGDWMKLPAFPSCRNSDEDPRPYGKELRAFADASGIAYADVSRRYGQLYRTGIAYETLLVNSINHPSKEGLKIFADALMELF
ncbi:MAG: SGNH/GDSL hydrolase family protein [Victivallaceae bacterium]|nr:SGNH/GDSL hydrolase family protein [Victivallaceae bacterium]